MREFGTLESSDDLDDRLLFSSHLFFFNRTYDFREALRAEAAERLVGSFRCGK